MTLKQYKSGTMGSTGLKIGRLGIGSSYGASTKDIEWAVDEGVSYLYWGSMRRPEMRDAIRNISKKDREKIVVCAQSYSRVPFLIEKSVDDALRALKIDYVDVLLLGWWNNQPLSFIENEARRVHQKGKAKFLAVSTHHRPYGTRVISDHLFDILHVRYNAAHRGAEKEIFAHVKKGKSPGIVTYTTTRWGTLLKKSKNVPDDMPVPTSTDCYRFVMSNPSVNVCICGPSNSKEMALAINALKKGPMNEEELKWMRAFGDIVHKAAPRPNVFMTAVTLVDGLLSGRKQ